MEKVGLRSSIEGAATRPMFSFYGSKWRAVPYYPAPGASIIEPFAGSACYAMNYYDRKVHINDIDPVIFGIWDYLTHVSPAEIRSLTVNPEHLDCLESQPIPQAAKDLIGFWLCKAYTSPVYTRVGWAKNEWDRWSNHYWSEGRRDRIAKQVDKIKHWKVTNLSYLDLENTEATWFIDPPYSGPAGRHYASGNAGIDFMHLAEWCKSRRGTSIVCEAEGASWLDFSLLGDFKTAKKGTKSREVVWVGHNEISLDMPPRAC